MAKPGERAALLGSSDGGLSAREAVVRLRQFGPNRPAAQRGRGVLARFGANFIHRLALLLWTSAALAFAAGITELGFAIVAVVVINGAFAFLQEHRAEHVVESLMKRVAITALVRRNGAESRLPAADLVPGDIVVLVAGDVIPADVVLLATDGFTVDLSAMTGESGPVERSEDAVTWRKHASLTELPCTAPAGAGVVTGSAVALVFATGVRSSAGRLVQLVREVDRGESLLERQVNNLSATAATVAILFGATTLVLATLLTATSFQTALIFSTGVIVALVPEGLLPTLSVSLAVGARRMAARGAAVRRLSAVEVVGSATVICTDKTGTLTENRLEVASLTMREEADLPSEVLLSLVTGLPVQEALEPLEKALVATLPDGADSAPALEDWVYIGSQPFDARLRYSAFTFAKQGVPWTFLKGAPEAVLARCRSPILPTELSRAEERAESAGQRVLLLAAGPQHAVVPAAIVAFHDPPRAGVKEALEACETAGVRVVMLTGDHPKTARAIGLAVGLATPETRVIEGVELDQMSASELTRAVSSNVILARIDPEQKLRVVEALRAAGEVVIVTGDGINDAPALRAADVGVAMGLRGTEVAKEAADFVLADDNFATIVAAIEEGRAIKRNIRRFISYGFTSNVAEVAPFLVYIFLPVPLPLAIMQALAIDLGTDLLPALALGVERPSPTTLDERPEPASRPLLTRGLALTFLWFGVLEAGLGLGAFFGYYAAEGWRPFAAMDAADATHLPATSVTFLAIVGGQVGCVFAQRSGRLGTRLSLDNPWLRWGLFFEVVFAVLLVYTPGLNGAFSTAPVHPAWLAVLPAAAVSFTVLDAARRRLNGTFRPAIAGPIGTG